MRKKSGDLRHQFKENFARRKSAPGLAPARRQKRSRDPPGIYVISAPTPISSASAVAVVIVLRRETGCTLTLELRRSMGRFCLRWNFRRARNTYRLCVSIPQDWMGNVFRLASLSPRSAGLVNQTQRYPQEQYSPAEAERGQARNEPSQNRDQFGFTICHVAAQTSFRTRELRALGFKFSDLHVQFTLTGKCLGTRKKVAR